MNDIAAFYKQVIQKYNRGSTGRDRPIIATHQARADNPLCGDEVELRFCVDAQTVTDAGYAGHCCAICNASAAMLCSHVRGMPAPASLDLARQLIGQLDEPSASRLLPEDLQALLAVRQYPVRVQCAALPWRAMLDAMESTE